MITTHIFTITTQYFRDKISIIKLDQCLLDAVSEL